MTGVIEGISNDVAAVILVCLMIIAYILNYCVRVLFPPSVSPIHPDSQNVVTEIRNQIPSRPPRQQNSDSSCAICLGDVKYGLETNCSHVFCGHCIITYWRTGRWTGPVACPICRQTVTVLMISFTSAELLEENSEEKNEVIQDVYNYNRRFSGEPRSIVEYLQDLPALLRHAMSDLFSFDGMLTMFRIRIVVCGVLMLLYVLSPLDLIPEVAVGVIGFIDDLFIMVIVAIYISMIYRSYLANRAEQAHAHVQ